jgi:hypothetical protein
MLFSIGMQDHAQQPRSINPMTNRQTDRGPRDAVAAAHGTARKLPETKPAAVPDPLV